MIIKGGVTRTGIKSLHCGYQSGQADPKLFELNFSTLPEDSFHCKVCNKSLAIVPKAIPDAVPPALQKVDKQKS